MSWVLEIGVIPANTTNVTIDRNPIASGELVTCGDQLVIGWRTPVGEQACYGTLAAGVGAGAPPVLTWDAGVVVPVPVTPRGQIPRPLESRYRRRDTEVLRWQLPAANQKRHLLLQIDFDLVIRRGERDRRAETKDECEDPLSRNHEQPSTIELTANSKVARFY